MWIVNLTREQADTINQVLWAVSSPTKFRPSSSTTTAYTAVHKHLVRELYAIHLVDGSTIQPAPNSQLLGDGDAAARFAEVMTLLEVPQEEQARITGLINQDEPVEVIQFIPSNLTTVSDAEFDWFPDPDKISAQEFADKMEKLK